MYKKRINFKSGTIELQLKSHCIFYKHQYLIASVVRQTFALHKIIHRYLFVYIEYMIMKVKKNTMVF